MHRMKSINFALVFKRLTCRNANYWRLTYYHRLVIDNPWRENLYTFLTMTNNAIKLQFCRSCTGKVCHVVSIVERKCLLFVITLRKNGTLYRNVDLRRPRNKKIKKDCSQHWHSLRNVCSTAGYVTVVTFTTKTQWYNYHVLFRLALIYITMQTTELEVESCE